MRRTILCIIHPRKIFAKRARLKDWESQEAPRSCSLSISDAEKTEFAILIYREP